MQRIFDFRSDQYAQLLIAVQININYIAVIACMLRLLVYYNAAHYVSTHHWERLKNNEKTADLRSLDLDPMSIGL